MSGHPQLERFVLENVPERSTLASSILEHTALERGVTVNRYSRRLIFLTLNNRLVPFHEMNGPDTGAASLRVSNHHHLRHRLLRTGDIPVPRVAFFTASQKASARRFAEGLRTQVRVGPAVGAETADDPTDGTFDSQWAQVADKAPVVVEEVVRGTRMRIFVADSRPVAVTAFNASRPGHRFLQRHLGSVALVDITDQAAVDVTDVAVAAARAVPGFPYGAVDMVVPEHYGSTGDTDQPVVTWMSQTAVPVAHFPTHGRPRDIAGSIVDHYLSTTRWQHARNTPHATAGPGRGAGVEPFFIGHDPPPP